MKLGINFDNVPAGQQLAAQMYERGVDTIFCAAGAVGIGAISEAVEKAYEMILIVFS